MWDLHEAAVIYDVVYMAADKCRSETTGCQHLCNP